MNIIDKFSNKTLFGKIIRIPLKFIPSNIIIPIIFGKLKGKKWIKGSGVNSYWIGFYELQKQKKVIEIVKKNDICYDVGANVGFYTLLFSEIVQDGGLVIAFEPSPNNINYLKKCQKINNLTNVKVIEAAVADMSGECFFDLSLNSSVGRISDNGKLKVKSISLDDFIANGANPPNIIKIDVEGAELKVLRGSTKLLQKYHPKIFLATHNSNINKDCIEFLQNKGYKIISLIKNKHIYESDELFAFYN
jgi:FkbM family methyltransferase